MGRKFRSRVIDATLEGRPIVRCFCGREEIREPCGDECGNGIKCICNVQPCDHLKRGLISRYYQFDEVAIKNLEAVYFENLKASFI